MKILFPYMARWHAVNWTRYHSLLIALADRGHDIVVLQPPPAALQETNFQEIAAVDHPRVQLIDVPIASFVWRWRWPLNKIVKRLAYGIAAMRSARRLLRGEKFDVVLTYNIPQYRFMFLRGPIRVFDFADDYVNMLGQELGPLDNKLMRRLASTLLDRMMAQAHITTTVSHELVRANTRPMQVLPNGVSFGKVEVAQAAALPATRANGKPIVGYVGAFEYFIDWASMIDAAVLLPEYHFLLVGSGREWEAARARAERQGCRNVEFTGGVPHQQVFSYIRAMDICLNLFHPIPVSHRACPIKLFEYLSMGKPVVSTPLDELRHIDRGFLYYASTSAEVAQRVREIFADGSAAQGRARLGRETVAAQYEWNAIAGHFEALLLERMAMARR